jgi:rhodanese-related sulfurtransferase
MSKGDVVVVDVRDAPELATGGKIKGAVHVPRGMLEFRADPESPYHNPALRKEKTVVLYCASGGRSALAGKRCKSLATSRSTMRAPSRIWRKRVWRQSQLRSSRSAKTRSPDITAIAVAESLRGTADRDAPARLFWIIS